MWSSIHAKTVLPSIAVMIVLAITIGWLLRNKSEKIRMIPIQVISVVIMLLEVAKQIYCIVTGYDLYSIPLHFCSLFLYFLPAMAFYFGKHKNIVRMMSVIACTALFFAMLIYPTIIYGESSILSFTTDFLSCHTVLYHNIVMFAFLLILALRLFDVNTKQDLIVILCTFLGYGIIASSMANILKTNFNNYYYSGIGPVENLRLSVIQNMGGYGQILYVFAMIAIMVALMFLAYGFIRLYIVIFDKIKQKINSKKQNA